MTDIDLASTAAGAADAAASPRHPRVRLLPKRHRRFRDGHPWVYSNEIEMPKPPGDIPAGALVTLENAGGEALGTACFNPNTLVVARRLAEAPDAEVGEELLAERLARALALRERLFPAPFYRLVHAEADGLPGLVVDRYGEVVVVQLNTAGMEALRQPILAALDRVLAPRAVVLRNDGAGRTLEGLPLAVETVKGTVDGPVELIENGATFLADVAGGQKTGWFYDQRTSRAAVAGLARGARVIDLFCYLGGFGIQAAAAGADRVVLVDRSEPALALAEAAAARNGVAQRCETRRASALELMERLAREGERFDVVVVDPPAFVKSRKDLGAGLRGYRKMIRLGAALTAPGGFLFAASCSHNVDAGLFAEQLRHGLTDAGRAGRILREAGAGPDHPVHPYLPESAYLKSALLQLD